MAHDHSHEPDAIAARLRRGPPRSYLRDWVYGGIDGAVTTFAVVSGVVGAELSTNVIVILGVANLVGDGFSMAAANYSGTRAEQHEFEHYRAREQRHIDDDPEGEIEEVRQIFRLKGFEGRQLEAIVERITSNRDQWVQTMLTEEYGLPLEVRSPVHAAAATLTAFVVAGAVPLLPYLFGTDDGFVLSASLTGVVFFTIGSAKSVWSIDPWWRLGLEALAIGAIAAALAFGIGRWLAGVVGS